MQDINNINILNSYEINSTDVIKAIIKFEKKPITSHNIGQIKVIETHISLIYLTQKFAYKQKKKVNFGFLDYTSLENRKFFCRKELSLNRRSCSGIYLDMPELRLKNDGSLLLGYKKGKIIDYLVRMKRIPDDKFLNSVLANSKKRYGFDCKGDNNKFDEGGRLQANICEDKTASETAYTDFNVSTLAHIDNILQKTAKRIYLFHKNANTSKRISMFGSVDILKDNFDDNYSAVYNFVSEEKDLNFDALNYLSNRNNQNNKNNLNSINKLINQNSQSNKSNLNNINKLSNQNNQNNLDNQNNLNGQNNQNNLDNLSNPANLSNLNKLNNLKNIFYNFINSNEFAQYIKLRISKGLIKDCHGDLRMEHIVIENISKINGICILDCVEFSEKLRFQDIYLDFAFLLMDMEHRGYFYESSKIFEYYKNYFSSALIELFKEYEFKVILIYKLYRALVRCKISILQIHNATNKIEQNNAVQQTYNAYNAANKIEQNNADNNNTDNIVQINEAVSYFNMALFYADLLAKPIIIMNVGLPGSGKSAISCLLSQYLNAPLLISDKIRKELFASKDVYLYDKSISQKVYDYMFEESKKAVELQKSAIMDATFLKAENRKIFIDYFTKKYCNFIIIYSKIYKENENIIIERLKNRRTKSDFKSSDFSKFSAGDADGIAHADLRADKDFKLSDFTADYSDAGAEVYLRMKKIIDEPPSQSCGATVITIDASLELKDRYNCVLAQLLKLRR